VSKFIILALGATVAALAFPPPTGRGERPLPPEAPIEPPARIIEAGGEAEAPDQPSKRAITAGRSAGAEPKR
jgi:hypothetical protein